MKKAANVLLAAFLLSWCTIDVFIMKGLFLTFAFILLLSTLAIGQEPSSTPTLPTDIKCILREMADTYDKVSWNEERARLDALLLSANQDPGSFIFLYVDAPPKQGIKSVKRRAGKMIKHLVSRDKTFAPERLVIAVRPTRGYSVVAYISPVGIELPECKDGCIQFTGKDVSK